jgi:hypothetical protein
MYLTQRFVVPSLTVVISTDDEGSLESGRLSWSGEIPRMHVRPRGFREFHPSSVPKPFCSGKGLREQFGENTSY